MLPERDVFDHPIRCRKNRKAFVAVLVLLLILTNVHVALPANPALAPAREKFEAGKYKEAASLLQAAMAQRPQDGSLAFWLARSYYELEMTDEAIGAAERAVEIEPRNSEYHQWLGRAYSQKAERTSSFSYARKTRAEFETAVSLSPTNLLARRDLLEYYMEAPWILGGSKAKGWRQAEVIAAIDPVEGCLARADYWQDLDKPESAAADYARVLELKPGRIDPYFEVAGYYAARKDAGRVVAAVEAAARLNPRDYRLAYYRGVSCILARERLTEADRDLQTYLATTPPRHDFPSHASARVWLGRLDEQLGKTQLAAEHYKTALGLEPGNKDALEGQRRLSGGR